eukprot:1489624-Amphidinium_carterae.1
MMASSNQNSMTNKHNSSKCVTMQPLSPRFQAQPLNQAGQVFLHTVHNTLRILRRENATNLVLLELAASA